MKINIFLDDVRDTPKNFHRCYWPEEVIEILSSGKKIGILSLDHDLGDDNHGTGLTVLNWLEKKVFEDPDFPGMPEEIRIHSQNPVGVAKMKQAVNSIFYYASVK